MGAALLAGCLPHLYITAAGSEVDGSAVESGVLALRVGAFLQQDTDDGGVALSNGEVQGCPVIIARQIDGAGICLHETRHLGSIPTDDS